MLRIADRVGELSDPDRQRLNAAGSRILQKGMYGRDELLCVAGEELVAALKKGRHAQVAVG